MKRHVFVTLPKWNAAIKPGVIWVRCPGWKGHACGRPHQEYLGPRDRDEIAAELRFLRSEVRAAAEILARRR
jgi:hypothetical protein